ncbi:Reovirus sigma C capsid protein [Anoxybacillus thermarum]|uniref:Reovirus sigma C capsid protein n=1 Tax=Anoxybacillus thermarum TaxID=404937 RepID=A0A0D0RSQ9_9BACL|nr:hypothetical protein [Anoxybacillus thermarum]KIQ94707.1 Reovirus sigma C capsid protein [Anoxybacillus thermarum]
MNDLREMLRSVLQEEFKPIHERLDRLEGTVTELQEGQKALQRDVTQLQHGQQKLETDVDHMKQSLGNMEKTQQQILEELRTSKNNQALMLNDLTSIKKSVDVTVSYLQRRSDVMFDKVIEHEKEILNLKARLPN